MHGFHRTHAAVRLEATSFVNDGLAGALFGSCKHGANHDGVSTAGQGLHDVASVADSAVGNHGHARAFEGRADFHHGTQLGNAHTGDDTRGADGTRADADFHGVHAGFDERQGRLSRGDVAGHDVDAVKGFLHVAHRVDHATAVSVGGVDNHGVHPGVDQGRHAFVGVGGHAHGRGHTEAAELVLARVGELAELDDVAVGDESDELAFAVDNRQLFDAVLAQDLLGLGQVASVLGDDQILARHELGDGACRLLFEAQVAVGHNAHQFAGIVRDRDAANLVFAHDGQRVACGGVLAERHGILDHAAFGTLDFPDLVGLRRNGHVLVHHADAAVARHGNRHFAFGDGVHGRTDNGGLQLNVA